MGVVYRNKVTWSCVYCRIFMLLTGVVIVWKFQLVVYIKDKMCGNEMHRGAAQT